MRRAWFLMIGLFGLVARSARAEPARFEWPGAACRDSEPAFEARLAKLVKPGERARLTGSVTVTPAGSRFEVQLSVALGGRSLGERRFEAPSCKAAAETAAVAAAMAAFSEEERPAAADPSKPEPARASSQASALRPDPQPDFSRDRAPPAPPPVRAQPRFGVLGSVHAGALPAPVVGGALELGLGLGARWSLAAQAGVSREQQRTQGSNRLALLRLFSSGLRGCLAAFVDEQVRVDGCAGAQVLLIRGRGSGFDVDRSASLLAVAPLLAFDVSLRAPQFLEWRAELEGSVPLSRQRFLVDGREAARAGAVVFAVRLGPVVRF